VGQAAQVVVQPREHPVVATARLEDRPGPVVVLGRQVDLPGELRRDADGVVQQERFDVVCTELLDGLGQCLGVHPAGRETLAGLQQRIAVHPRQTTRSRPGAASSTAPAAAAIAAAVSRPVIAAPPGDKVAAEGHERILSADRSAVARGRRPSAWFSLRRRR
jgi:hypothetical protein